MQKEGTQCGVLEPVPHVEAGTMVPYTHLAFLDGDNIRETAQHPGPICKHRNFWLINEEGQ